MVVVVLVISASPRIPRAASLQDLAQRRERLALVVRRAQVPRIDDAEVRRGAAAHVHVLARQHDHAPAAPGDVLVDPAEDVAAPASEAQVLARAALDRRVKGTRPGSDVN